MLGESDVKTPVSDLRRQDKASRFFRPREESAKVDKRKPPVRQPKKKEEVGRPVIIEPEHSRPHSDMMDV